MFKLTNFIKLLTLTHRESKQGKQPYYLSTSQYDIHIMPITLYIRTQINTFICICANKC